MIFYYLVLVIQGLASSTIFFLFSFSYSVFTYASTPFSNSKASFFSSVASNLAFLHASFRDYFLTLANVVAYVLLEGGEAGFGEVWGGRARDGEGWGVGILRIA